MLLTLTSYKLYSNVIVFVFKYSFRASFPRSFPKPDLLILICFIGSYIKINVLPFEATKRSSHVSFIVSKKEKSSLYIL